MSEPIPTTTSLAALGQGGRHDRLDFRLVVRLLARCLELLRPVRLHLAGLFGGFALLGLLGLVFGAVLVIAFWNSVLEGSALTGIEAKLLLLEPARYVTAGDLDAEARRVVLERIFAASLALLFGVLPAILALYYYQVWILQRVNQLLRVRLVERLQSLSLRFHSGQQASATPSIARYQDSAMVTQLIDVLVIAPIGMRGSVSLTASSWSWRSSIGWLALVILARRCGRRSCCSGYWSSRSRLRVRFRHREGRRTVRSPLASRRRSAGHQGDQGLRGRRSIEQARFEADSLHAAFDAAYRSSRTPRRLHRGPAVLAGGLRHSSHPP